MFEFHYDESIKISFSIFSVCIHIVLTVAAIKCDETNRNEEKKNLFVTCVEIKQSKVMCE